MDPVTQGALGGIVVEALLGRRLGKRAWLIGAMSGMAPDLDVLIRSPSDVLVGIEYHRHFTHSLAFVPFGGVLVALPIIIWLMLKKRTGVPDFAKQWTPGLVVLACMIGWATHAPLDCGTSYGTLYFWPFSRARVALDFLPIVDFLYTFPLIVGIVLIRKFGFKSAWAGLLVSHIYAGLCLMQSGRADDVQAVLQMERGHVATRGRTIPYIGSNVMWRSIYEHQGVAYTDFIVVPWFSSASVIDGPQVPLVQTATALSGPWATHARRDETFEMMHWFSGGWLGVVERAKGPSLCDLRLSVHPTKTYPVICLAPSEPLSNDRARPAVGDLIDAAFRHDPRQRKVLDRRRSSKPRVESSPH